MQIYLDNAATTKPCSEAVSAVLHNMSDNYGNPSSLHAFGLKAEQAVTEARKAIAAALVCPPESITFTSGATEANNAVFAAAKQYGKRKNKIVISAIEHPSVTLPAKELADKYGFDVTVINPERNGIIDADIFAAAVDDKTCLVSCMLVNNETGAVQPVRRMFTRIKRDFPDVITHCDAVQGFLKTPFKAADLSADIITLSGHKVHAVKGIGAMYIKKGVFFPPFILGGGQEKGLRAGTESVPLIAGFGAAVRTLLPNINTAISNAEELNAYLRKRLSKLDYVSINSPFENVSPFILNFSVSGVKSEIMLHHLETANIYASSASVCSKGKPSHVLKAMGLPDKTVDSAIRVSFGANTTMGDIDMLLKAVAEGVGKYSK